MKDTSENNDPRDGASVSHPTESEGPTRAACTGSTPRLAKMVRLLHELDDDEFRLLPAVLSEQILERERQRARRLQHNLGEQCDVIWPGQAEFWDVMLVDVDEETGIAHVQYSPGGRRLEVPASSVVTRD